MRSVICSSVSPTVAPGHSACTTMVLTVKSGIFAPPEPEVGPDARDRDDEHEIGHQGTVPDRPFGEVEALHWAAPRRRTFWPGRSVCTPAVTTISPVSSPCEITTVAGS